MPPTDDPSVQLAAFIPYGLVGYLVALSCLLVALLRARHRQAPTVITLAVGVLTACHVAWLAPLFVDDHRAAATPVLRPMSLNVFLGDADSSEVAERATQADIVILIETTPSALTALKSFGWELRRPNPRWR